MPQIPVIDLSEALAGDPAARLRTGQEMDRTCREIGFFTIAGHGVPAAVMDGLRDTANAFFALSLEEKRRAVHPVPGTPRGYIALGVEALSHGNAVETPPDLKEYYHFGREGWPDEPYYTSEEGRRYFRPNLWPERPAGFAEAAANYYAAMEALTVEMMRLAALGLGIPEHFFDDKIDRHITAMRLNHYPEQHQAPAAGQLRAGAHTDYGLLTILNGENVPGGLQAQTRDGRWLDVETDPRSFVVNIGDLLMRWTNDRWVSNVHRVVNPPDSEAARSRRLSIAFFHHPNYDASIECIAPPGGAKYPPVLSGAYRDEKYRQTRVAAA
ncbi:isopenicillin N synthase family dioxygenase [Pararoseomonas indoligenes]|uniref:2-oxoglutarate-dependent ethylene/succinate-forming enzyme n=1 Tax=Roseomonas indoligenes TaxID=2820811 RepID=A0A940SA98_9PROT|nr:isopenicillin N synthase family oxygenase [Pararoseomonas indoligenes]MBP0496138.1 isopenicillin N synthase family oxygenase [Pararoseomonas indoligenes]